MEYKITIEQILAVAKTGSLAKTKLKQFFPDAFNTVFELGKWYKYENSDNGFPLVCYQGETSAFGFDGLGGWGNTSTGWTFKTQPNNWELAKPDTVFLALKTEFNRRYTEYGVKCLITGHILTNTSFTDIEYNVEQDTFIVDGCTVYKEGLWCLSVLPSVEITIEDIAERFGLSASQIKIVKNSTYGNK